MAPEYVMRGHFSVKSDVYSFGVLVLEIVSGQKNSSFCHEGNLEDLLGYVSNIFQNLKHWSIAIDCNKRKKNMKSSLILFMQIQNYAGME